MVLSYLEQLQKDTIVKYKPIKNDAEITFLLPREDDYTINKFSREIKQYIHQKKKKSDDLISFVNYNNICRSVQVLDYFDDPKSKNCGVCDVCITKKRKVPENISSSIIQLLKNKHSLTSKEISAALTALEKDILIHLRQLLIDDKISLNHQNKYTLKK